MCGWSSTIDVDDDLRSQGSALGVDVDALVDQGETAGGEDDGPYGVWPENWAALGLFLAVQTQWKVIPMDVPTPVGSISVRHYIGLDYQSVDVVMRRRGLDGSHLFEDLQTMEAAALKVLHEAPL